MLTQIHLRDFVLVDTLEQDFGGGMTALTGETGAGKSILVDALGLVLGDRADTGTLRKNARRAEIAAIFDVSGLPEVRNWLLERDLGEDEECLLRRTINAEGRSRGYINGSSVPNQLLRELGDHLVDIHGQHEHQSLLKPEEQRRLLDGFGGHAKLLGEMQIASIELLDKRTQLEQLRNNSEELNARIDLLRFQVSELQALDLAEGEATQINEEHARLANAGELTEFTQSALDTLYDAESTNVFSQLSALSEQADTLSRSDSALGDVSALLRNAQIQIDECVSELRAYSDRLELDPARLNWLEERIGEIVSLSRKHRCEADELPDKLAAMQSELETLDGDGTSIESLEQEVAHLTESYITAAKKLTAARKKTARQLEKRVTTIMEELGMTGGGLQISIAPQQNGICGPHGMDRIEFLVRTNPGAEFSGLRKTASGGELSRISLAIQVVTSASGATPTLVFDEVDSGIGGATAEVVGRYLRELGDNRQVLTVTHLPQVAAQAHHHFQVSKAAAGDLARSELRELGTIDREREIARMLGGVKITDSTLEHAREMIALAQQGKTASDKKKRQTSRKKTELEQ